MANCKKIIFTKNCDKMMQIVLKFGLSEKGVFTASGYVYNKRKMIYGGQCIDVVESMARADKIKDPNDCALIYKVAQWWKLYHLNDMHAGTPEQENALLSAGLKDFANKYKECCEYLEKMGLLVVRGYRFGCGWLKQEIPADIQKDMLETIEKTTNNKKGETMKNYILHDSGTRAEYKRRWKAIERAKQKGLDTDLIDAFYGAMIKRGYQREIAIAALFCAARDGLFGFINNWKR